MSSRSVNDDRKHCLASLNQLELSAVGISTPVLEHVKKLAILTNFGVKDVILDLGFGFGKTLDHNWNRGGSDSKRNPKQ